MTTKVRIDPHAHLYDSYSTREWARAAFSNLRGGVERAAEVIVVDRQGQDSLSRLRREVPSFADWRDLWDGQAGRIEFDEGALTVVQGVQYVTSERIEVLGLGVARAAPDAMMASEYVAMVTDAGGLACLPWSPGKWLGARGEVVRRLLDTTPTTGMTVGDIALRSPLGPPSSLLRYAQRRGISVLSGTDPLPRVEDQYLIGSFGLEVVAEEADAVGSWGALKGVLVAPGALQPWGRRNSVATAVRRFIASLTKDKR
jgi:hypothetical protein